MKNVTVIGHPLIQHNLTRLRDERTSSEDFRRGLSEVAALMVYEATRSFPTKKVKVKTPLAVTGGFQLEREVILIPVLRAGLGMLPGHSPAHPARARRLYRTSSGTRKLWRQTAYHKSLPADLREV